MTTYMTLQELRKAASEKKIKSYYKLSKLELVKALNLDETIVCKPSSGKEVLITYLDTGKKIKCKSIYQCSKLLNKNSGSIYYYINSGHPMNVDGDKIVLAFA